MRLFEAIRGTLLFLLFLIKALDSVVGKLIRKEGSDLEPAVTRICKLLKSDESEHKRDISAKSIRKDLRKWLKLVYANSFGPKLPILDDQAYALAVFSKASMFNHSCAPNCHYYFLGKIDVAVHVCVRVCVCV